MNLSGYMTYNISIKPNSYFDQYSTVGGDTVVVVE